MSSNDESTSRHSHEAEAVGSSMINPAPIHTNGYHAYGAHPMNSAMQRGVFPRSPRAGQAPASQMELLRGPDPFTDVAPDIPAAFLAVASPQPHGYSPNSRTSMYRPTLMSTPPPPQPGLDMFHRGMHGEASMGQGHEQLRLSPPSGSGSGTAGFPPSSPIRSAERPVLYPRTTAPSNQSYFMSNPFIMPEQHQQRAGNWMPQQNNPGTVPHPPPTSTYPFYGYVPRSLYHGTEPNGSNADNQGREGPDSR